MSSKAGYTDSQIVNIKQQFSSMDRDNDGFITEKEFIESIKNSNRDPKEYDCQEFFSKADKNKDGKIAFNEFMDACYSMGLGVNAPASGAPSTKDPKEVDAIFRNFDLDADGFISSKELGKVLSGQGEDLNDAELSDMIKAADKNNDGKVDREEFAKMI
ncbi:calmodulin-like 3 [Mortierella polycephala]|uniref:Calmodulin-like 3 n=1 Tax=Mortierella polycephala TaxID=41804 RepID=A0A9P6TU80_9FUNG|nr:calmodulin-like 3 [Mortierella polycephala]